MKKIKKKKKKRKKKKKMRTKSTRKHDKEKRHFMMLHINSHSLLYTFALYGVIKTLKVHCV